jgi:hypothetical protein
MKKTELEKLEKRKGMIDMMTSMHSELSSMYRKNIFVLDILLVILSIILLTFVFADQYLLTNFRIDKVVLKLILGLATVLLTVLSLLSYIFDWRGKKTCHDHAFNALIVLKNEWKLFLFNKKNITYENVNSLERTTALILSQCIKIDDKLFNKLKKKHYMKMTLSKSISDNPNLPLFLHKFNLKKEAFLKSRKKYHDPNR